MTQRITVVPASGRAVTDPEAGDLLPAEGGKFRITLGGAVACCMTT